MTLYAVLSAAEAGRIGNKEWLTAMRARPEKNPLDGRSKPLPFFTEDYLSPDWAWCDRDSAIDMAKWRGFDLRQKEFVLVELTVDEISDFSDLLHRAHSARRISVPCPMARILNQCRAAKLERITVPIISEEELDRIETSLFTGSPILIAYLRK